MVYIAEMKREMKLPMNGAPNVVEELKVTRKCSTSEKAKGIKDAVV